MKLMDAPSRRQAAAAAFGFAVILSQSPAQAQFYGGWGPYPFAMLPMPPPVMYPRATQPRYQPIPPGTIRRMVANMGLRLVAEPRQKGHIYLAETARLLCHDLHSAWRSFGGGFNIFQIVIWSMPRKPA